VRNAVEAAMGDAEDTSVHSVPSEPKVILRSAVQGEFVSIIIEDNGPGLANPANLFVPFYTTKKSGTGVGLALARQIAEGHGGTLELRDRSDGPGCLAEVRIPLVSQITEQRQSVLASRS
jgi:signal transduction histidine kinase